mmetsp:Transcript_34084/g.60254  ORF Transcript_34084/g.60254 Transcript_34084/m.60254 type:complete len:181 (-) Transcript_34084:148-690(-)
MLSDLWGAPPCPSRKTRFSDWFDDDDTLIFKEKPLQGQIYRRAFRYIPLGKVEKIRTGRRETPLRPPEHVPKFTLNGSKPARILPESQSLIVNVDVEHGKIGTLTQTLMISAGETVGQLKSRLVHDHDLPVTQRYRLLWRDVGLPDDRFVAACGVPNGAELKFLPAWSRPSWWYRKDRLL